MAWNTWFWGQISSSHLYYEPHRGFIVYLSIHFEMECPQSLPLGLRIKSSIILLHAVKIIHTGS